MRIPLSWLGEHVSLAAGITPEQVHADLVRVGFEEEAIRRFEATGPIVVGEVLAREPEPQSNGKTINWCQVRVAPPGEPAADGGEDVRGIVCGAHNFEAGDKVVVTLPGAVLPGDFAIAARKTYGHVSDGMIASAKELGLGEDHEGIIVLSRLGLDPEVGEDALALLGLNDSAVEINVTPDRGYAFSIRGVAREYGHSTGAAFTDPVLALEREMGHGAGFPVVLDDRAPIRGREGCTGFVARVVRGIDPSLPTPPWMVSRLVLAGIRSISLPVDVSNYVMLELGQPLHAYDLAKLTGGITVRRAQPGETLVTLDGKERRLDVEDLLITDESGPIGMAGVMGGEATEVSGTTTDVLIEAATFDPVSIARTLRRHKLPSEASKRYERGVDPFVARAAAQRMVDLLVELAGGTADELGCEILPPSDRTEVLLPLARVNGFLGTDYSDDEIRGAIEMIGCDVADHELADGSPAIVAVAPSWRSDLSRPADLIEEVARIVGYDRIPSELPVAPAGRGRTREQRLRRRAAEVATAYGLDEVQNYPFVSQTQLQAFGAEAGDAEKTVHAVRLANPLDGETPFLRRSLLPGLVGAAQRNVSRGLTDLALVEFGSVFVPGDPADPATGAGTAEVPPLAERPSDETLEKLNASIPAQPLRAAGLLLGDAVAKQPGESPRAHDWADALDAARAVAGAVGAELVVRQGAHRAFHPGRTAELCALVGGEPEAVGVAGELLPELVAESHLPGRVAAFELDLSRLIEVAPREPETSPLSTYPAATQDLTLLVDTGVPAEAVRAAVVAGAGDLLEHAAIVDDYRGKGVPEGLRALTFALRFRAGDRTLKAEEASEAKLAGVRAAETAFGAKLRE